MAFKKRFARPSLPVILKGALRKIGGHVLAVAVGVPGFLKTATSTKRGA